VRPTIGIIGAGRMGSTHSKSAHYLFKTGLIDGELVGACDVDPERAQSFARLARMRIATTDPDEIIASPEINTIYVCTPTYNHRALAEKAAAAGKALFCEKPLAFNGEDAVAMSDAAKRAGITHQVGLVMRYSAVMNVTRALSREPDAGRVMTAVLVDDQFFPIQGHYASTWRGDVSQVGAGTLLEHAIHDIDMLIWMFGPVRRVTGVIRNFAGKEGVEDLSNALIEFESGAVANHVSIWHNILHRGSSRRMTVCTENAQFAWDDDDWAGTIRADRQRDGGRTEIPPEEVVSRCIELQGITEDPLLRLMRPEDGGIAYLLENYRFLQAVSAGRPADPSFEPAVYAHRVVDAIYRSAREGRPVEVS